MGSSLDVLLGFQCSHVRALHLLCFAVWACWRSLPHLISPVARQGAATATLPALHHPGFPQNRLGFPWHARMGQATLGYVPAIARDVHWRLRQCWNLTRRGAGSRSPPFSQPSIFSRQLSDPRLRRPWQRRTASIDLADGSTVIVDTATWASTACCHAAGPDRRSQSEVLGHFSVRLAAGHVSFLGLAAQPAQPDRCGDPFAVGCRPRR